MSDAKKTGGLAGIVAGETAVATVGKVLECSVGVSDLCSFMLRS